MFFQLVHLDVMSADVDGAQKGNVLMLDSAVDNDAQLVGRKS